MFRLVDAVVSAGSQGMSRCRTQHVSELGAYATGWSRRTVSACQLETADRGRACLSIVVEYHQYGTQRRIRTQYAAVICRLRVAFWNDVAPPSSSSTAEVAFKDALGSLVLISVSPMIV